MPNIYRRDSVARADQGNDIYSSVRNPHAQRPNKVITPLDRMESGAERQDRLLMRQIHNGYARIMLADGSAIKLAALLAKFSFMALAMPPYLALYIMPKAIFTKLLPALFQKIKEQLEIVPALFTGAGQWLQTNLLSALIKPFAAAKQNLTDYLALMKHPSQNARKFVARLASIPGLAIQPFKKPVRFSLLMLKDIAGGAKFSAKLIAKASGKIKDKAVGIVQKGAEHVKAVLQPVIQPVINWFANTYQATAQTVKQSGQTVLNTVYKAAEKVTQRLMPPIQKVARTAKKMAKKMVLVAKPVLDWGKKQVSKAIAKAKIATAKIQEKTTAAREAIVAQVQATVHQAKLFFIPLFNPFVDAAKASVNFLAAPVARLMKGGIQKGNKWGQQGKFIFTGAKRGLSAIATFAQKSLTIRISILRAWLAKWLVKAFVFIKTIPAKVVKSLIWSSKKALAGIKNTGRFIKQTARWSVLLFRFGMQLVRELKDELGYWLSRKG